MIRFFTFAATLLSAACSPACADWNSTIAASNPLNWYRMDDPVNGIVAHDYGSQGLDATYGEPAMTGPPAVRGVPGLVGTAVEFTGPFQNITIRGTDLTGDWSAEFIIKKTLETDSQTLLTDPAGIGGSALKLEQWKDTHQLGYSQYTQADYLFSPSAVAPLGQFADVVFVNSASGLRVYVDGAFAGATRGSFPLPRYYIGEPERLYAVLDEVVIYNRALSPAEVASHFASIPEPGSLLLCVIGLMALPTRGRRRR